MEKTLSYLPKWHSSTNQELYKKLTSLLDRTVLNTEFDIANLRNKYLDYSTLSKDLTEMLIKELGYNYVTDVLNLSKEELKNIIGYLGVIHAFKGTKQGFELCLRLMGIEYTMEEWWETDPRGEPDTFSMLIDLNLSTVKMDTFLRFREFVRQYVYPVLDKLVYEFHAELLHLYISMGGICEQEINSSDPMQSWMSIRIAGSSGSTVSGTIKLFS